MKASDFNLYKVFEKNLEPTTSDTPCKDAGWPQYFETETHGVFPIRMTVDLYSQEAFNCDQTCKDICCKNGGGDACVRACGCEGACPKTAEVKMNAGAACQDDIKMSGEALTTAAMEVVTAVKECAGKTDPAACSADIAKVVAQLGTATTDISKAVADCSGSGSPCATDIGNTVTALGNAVTMIS